jgi:hypothetical protein
MTNVLLLHSRYMTPPLVTHLGDIVLGTTKPQLPTAAKFIYPRQAQIVPSPAVGTPLMIKMLASGLVYDAEYTWRAFINGGAAAGPSRRACLLSARVFHMCSSSLLSSAQLYAYTRAKPPSHARACSRTGSSATPMILHIAARAQCRQARSRALS